jgi:hypothetical protein
MSISQSTKKSGGQRKSWIKTETSFLDTDPQEISVADSSWFIPDTVPVLKMPVM